MTIKIAFYGKGGIGKSTIATNISALLGKNGLRVLHIGCDPKADSTRLLTDGKIPTVLSQVDSLDIVHREEIVFSGKYGVQCVEAGGPEAGTGCAGLGIVTAMDELKGLGVFSEKWDVIVYDVLGDVVCGGFSVPMRQHFVDKVYVVTSANYMSLYAANNILKGISRYGTGNNGLCGGIIGNHINSRMDEATLSEFCKLVHTPCITMLKDDILMQKADYQRELFALNEHNLNAKKLVGLTKNIIAGNNSCSPMPMSNDDMENFATTLMEKIYDKEANY